MQLKFYRSFNAILELNKLDHMLFNAFQNKSNTLKLLYYLEFSPIEHELILERNFFSNYSQTVNAIDANSFDLL